MTVYAPGTQEKDLTKLNISLQQNAAKNQTNADNIATNTTNIATNTTNIAANTTAITALQTPNYGLVNSGGALGVTLSKITASLGADVALNNVSNYFDGPSIAQGTSGTWFVFGTVTLTDTAGGASINIKLWDGTTVISSGFATLPAANARISISLSGYLASPAANIRISCQDASSTSGKILFNLSGNSKDSTISAIRIA